MSCFSKSNCGRNCGRLADSMAWPCLGISSFRLRLACTFRENMQVIRGKALRLLAFFICRPFAEGMKKAPRRTHGRFRIQLSKRADDLERFQHFGELPCDPVHRLLRMLLAFDVPGGVSAQAGFKQERVNELVPEDPLAILQVVVQIRVGLLRAHRDAVGGLVTVAGALLQDRILRLRHVEEDPVVRAQHADHTGRAGSVVVAHGFLHEKTARMGGRSQFLSTLSSNAFGKRMLYVLT